MILETLCFSINSDISSLINVSGVSNNSFASCLTSSVFPTPVGPTKIKEDGLRLGLICTLPLRMAADTSLMASS
ncbi:hypothetical protein SDC9_200854 [bioreactor metagenome]|uniref:Uncharacterized protein n=1 Tax=bioreactor metagenome TaxID=1076179 RepID=A0A645IQ84_9ZZZZ